MGKAILGETCIDTIRFLAMDAVEKANSGHPGTPMGAAPMAYVLRAEEYTGALLLGTASRCSMPGDGSSESVLVRISSQGLRYRRRRCNDPGGIRSGARPDLWENAGEPGSFVEGAAAPKRQLAG